MALVTVVLSGCDVGVVVRFWVRFRDILTVISPKLARGFKMGRFGGRGGSDFQ
jgi:hypothetical protein